MDVLGRWHYSDYPREVLTNVTTTLYQFKLACASAFPKKNRGEEKIFDKSIQGLHGLLEIQSLLNPNQPNRTAENIFLLSRFYLWI